MINYYVIGGQYNFMCYGGTETLLEAKRLAGKHEEYWDNWQGWHRPSIYAAVDCTEVETENGTIIVPRNDNWERSIPVAVWDGKHWTDGKMRW